jgi:hypothetical protein
MGGRPNRQSVAPLGSAGRRGRCEPPAVGPPPDARPRWHDAGCIRQATIETIRFAVGSVTVVLGQLHSESRVSPARCNLDRVNRPWPPRSSALRYSRAPQWPELGIRLSCVGLSVETRVSHGRSPASSRTGAAAGEGEHSHVRGKRRPPPTHCPQICATARITAGLPFAEPQELQRPSIRTRPPVRTARMQGRGSRYTTGRSRGL